MLLTTFSFCFQTHLRPFEIKSDLLEKLQNNLFQKRFEIAPKIRGFFQNFEFREIDNQKFNFEFKGKLFYNLTKRIQIKAKFTCLGVAQIKNFLESDSKCAFYTNNFFSEAFLRITNNKLTSQMGQLLLQNIQSQHVFQNGFVFINDKILVKSSKEVFLVLKLIFMNDQGDVDKYIQKAKNVVFYTNQQISLICSKNELIKWLNEEEESIMQNNSDNLLKKDFSNNLEVQKAALIVCGGGGDILKVSGGIFAKV